MQQPSPHHPLQDIVKAYDIRGLVGEQLDAGTCRALGSAFATEVVLPESDGEPRLAVGHDMRPSSPELAEAFALGAAEAGAVVEVVGLTSTDQLYLVSGSRDAAGVMFTASHNPAAYNGLKLCRRGARPVSLDTGLAQVRDTAVALLQGRAAPAVAPGGSVSRRDTLAEYAAHLRALVPLDGIRPLRVVVDAGNGMGGLTVPAVLGEAAGLPALPVTVEPLYFELDGTFPNHDANPLDLTTLVDLQAAVRASGADLGLATDGDADRCFVIDERGEVVDPSTVTALVAVNEVARARADGEAAPTVLYNLITSRAVPDVVTEAGGRAVRTRVGHSYIKAEMAATDAVFGGEHSAHFYFRDFYGADSGMLAALHVLQALGRTPVGTTLSQLVGGYARYARSGEVNSTVGDAARATERVLEAVAAGPEPVELDHLDGVTVSAVDGSWWFNLRPSNTEPLLRLNVEAVDETTLARVRDHVLSLVRSEEAPA
ncbi:phosphomannomutase/phosphoglucomutase [Jannaschia sp. R86511]|uniref:phosphomannomutase/phosphoglucomutase n=1 Tax=Jannaschia sp. R86511 TaxID=3093853 RepID=UPI0036D2C392